MTAIIIFYGTTQELNKVQKIASIGLNSAIDDISTPKEFDIDGIDALYYTVEFTQNGWLNIIELQEDLVKQNCYIDIIHILSDETSIEVLSTDSKYDAYEDINNPQSMSSLASLYELDLEINDEYEEEDDDEYDEDFSDFD